MKKTNLLLSINEEYSSKIFEGTKTIELRRVRPKVKTGDLVLIYVPKSIMAIVGTCEVVNIVDYAPSTLWNKFKLETGLTKKEYNNYYSGTDRAHGIIINKPTKLKKPLTLDYLRNSILNFHPPQSYRYLCSDELNMIGI